ncbi:hypothetical protein Ate01nite_64910 [Actinoplanes teichomyceticus]|nr:hypothetical protein Ate01nite_64910 [Actinoplanes teichomyceticus]
MASAGRGETEGGWVTADRFGLLLEFPTGVYGRWVSSDGEEDDRRGAQAPGLFRRARVPPAGHPASVSRSASLRAWRDRRYGPPERPFPRGAQDLAVSGR